MKLAVRALVLVIAFAACGDNVAGPPAEPEAGPPPLRVFLAFDGVTLQPGTATSSNTNTTPFVTTTTTVPPYLDGIATRGATIDAIVAEATKRLAPLNLEIVTTRPVGEYFMIVVTGPASVIGFSNGTSAVAYIGCTAMPPDLAHHHDGIALMFQSSAGTTDQYGPAFKGNLVLGALALENGVPPTTSPTDCLCWAAAGCGANTQACTIGGAGTAVDVPHSCPGTAATDDELGLLVAEFGAHR
jgi:hypothetical protein